MEATPTAVRHEPQEEVEQVVLSRHVFVVSIFVASISSLATGQQQATAIGFAVIVENSD